MSVSVLEGGGQLCCGSEGRESKIQKRALSRGTQLIAAGSGCTSIRAHPGEAPVAHVSVNTNAKQAEAGSASLAAEFSAPGSW